jgi:hypothetical protein
MCDPEDPATQMQPGTGTPCDATTCSYTGGAPATGPAGGCPPPIAQITCGQRLQGTTRNGAQQQVSYYNESCGRNVQGPEVAYAFTAPMPEANQPRKALLVTVWVNDGNGQCDEDLDIFVIGPAEGNACAPENCIEWAPRRATFLAIPGDTYPLIIDGRRPSDFFIDVQCQEDVIIRQCSTAQPGADC